MDGESDCKKQRRKPRARGKKLGLPGCSTALSLLSSRDKRLSSSSRIVIVATLPPFVEIVTDRSRFDSEGAQLRDNSSRGLQLVSRSIAEITINSGRDGIILLDKVKISCPSRFVTVCSTREPSFHCWLSLLLSPSSHPPEGLPVAALPLIVADFSRNVRD